MCFGTSIPLVLFIPLSLLPLFDQINAANDILNQEVQKEFMDRIQQLSKFVDLVVLEDSPGSGPGKSPKQEFICGRDERQVTSINETTSRVDVCCLDRKGSLSYCSSSRCQATDLRGRQLSELSRVSICRSGCGGISKNRNGANNRAITTTTGNRFFCSGMVDIFESIGCSKTAKKTVQVTRGANQARFCCSGSGCTASFDCTSTESSSTSQDCCQSGNKEYCNGDEFTEPDYGPEYKPPPAGVPTQRPTQSPSETEPVTSSSGKQKPKQQPSSSGSSQQQQQEEQQTVVVNCRTTNVELVKSFKETTDILERISSRINAGLKMIPDSSNRIAGVDGNSSIPMADGNGNMLHQTRSQVEFIRALASIPNQVFSVINKISQSATRDIGPDIFQFFRVITE